MDVSYYKKTKKFILTTDHTAYCLGIDPGGNVQHLYWGAKLPYVEDYPDCHEIGQTVGIGKNLENPRNLSLNNFYYPYEATKAVINEEYVGWGGLNFVESCLKVDFPDGVRDLVLKYHAHAFKSDNEFVVTLKDSYYPLFVHLWYRIFPDVDILVRWAAIENRCEESVCLESVQSAVWHLPDNRAYRLSSLSGRWADEFNLNQSMLQQGKKVMESRRGITSHHETPWFALDPEGASSEQNGPVWFGTLAWSGNWKMVVERTSNQQTRVTAGINDFDFAWELNPGETFKTPECIGGYTPQGFGGASRSLHRYALRYVYPKTYRASPWPVFYNTWETYWFGIDERKLMALAEKAAQLGIEVFHVDDGWFSTRRDEYSGLGDWFVSKEKFPNGLKPLVEKVKSLGMEFSLWIEPENVNVDSEIYRAHPDWVYGFPTRTPSIQRESLILNLGRLDVREHIWGCLSQLIREYGLRHFKWDLNRHMSEPGWSGLPVDNQKELWVRHIQGVYEIKERIKKEFTHVSLECCSGGGGRVDYGILKYCELALVSDNHDPLTRLLIHEGYSYVFPAKTMGSWVTDVPSPLTDRSLPLKFMFHMAMTGALGIQSNILEWSEQETKYARKMIQLYKEIRPIIQEGDLYHLNSLRKDHIAAVQYVDREAERSVIFAFMWTNSAHPAPIKNIIRWGKPRFIFTLYPRGLVSDRRYAVNGACSLRSGASLMNAGVAIELEGDGDSLLVRLDAVGEPVEGKGKP
jgi:alpha-galactosidase